MSAPIAPVGGINGISLPAAPSASKPGGAFQDVLSSAIRDVEAFGQNASASVERFLSGEGEELHSTVLATQRAELSFDLFLQMRNKVVNAYQEIMRMPM
jgi:flagellar hook-basal body complex protein FliE